MAPGLRLFPFCLFFAVILGLSPGVPNHNAWGHSTTGALLNSCYQRWKQAVVRSFRRQKKPVRSRRLLQWKSFLKKGRSLTQKKKYSQAAAVYLNYINKNPRHRCAPHILWHTSSLYKKSGRMGSRSRLLKRIVREYRRWQYSDKVQFELAYQYEVYFSFHRALVAYSLLSNSLVFRRSKFRKDALYGVAVLEEMLQMYRRAALSWVRFSSRFREEVDAPAALFRAGTLYKKLGDRDAMLQVFRLFVRRYDHEVKEAHRVVLAYGELLLDSQRKKASTKKAARRERLLKRSYRSFLERYIILKSKLNPEQVALVRHVPARITYELGMMEFRRFSTLKIRSQNPRRWKKQIRDMMHAYSRVKMLLTKTLKHHSVPWSLCALSRVAEGKEVFARAILKAPLPRDGKGAWTKKRKKAYFTNLKAIYVRPLQRQAKKEYVQVVDKAQRWGVMSECVRQAQKSLHRLDPRFPLPRVSIPLLRFEPLVPLPLVTSLR